MSMETLRSQANSVALVALEDKIQFVEYYYGSDNQKKYIAKVTNTMAQQVKDQIGKIKKQIADPLSLNLTPDLAWENLTFNSPENKYNHIYGVAKNNMEGAKTGYSIVKICRLMSYEDLILNCCASQLQYLTAVIDPTEAEQMEKIENNLVNTITKKITVDNKKQLAISLLGEAGFNDLKIQTDKLCE